MTKELEIRLLGCKTIREFVTMFMGLSIEDKLSIFTEPVEVKKGTELFRIRRIQGIDDSNNPKEWGPVPVKYAQKNRFNYKGESVLYVASSPDFLEREVRLQEGEEYYLAKYICKNTFCVGSFLGTNNQINTLIHKVSMSINGSDEMTDSELQLMNQYYNTVKGKTLDAISLDMLASLYIYRMIPDLYEITNKFGKLILKKNENGIRYSSVYAPIELSGADQIITLNGMESGNYVLTPKGYENIAFQSVEKKIAKKVNGLDTMIKVFSKYER